MPNSPTIVSAALSDKELQASINQMVANFDKGLQTMLEHSNEYVGKIQESLQKIGNTNFGAKGSNDGGVVKQTKAQDDFTDAVKRSTSEIKRQGKETAMSFDQIAAAQQKAVQSQGDNTLKKSFNKQELQQYIDRLRELQAEYIKVNTQEGGGAKSDKIKADMRNLEELIAKYREILRNLDYVNSRQGTIDVKKWVQDLGAVDDRYKKLTRWYTVLEKEDQRRIASEEKANQKRLADLEKEKAAQDKVIKSYQDSVLKAEFGKVMKMPTSNIDEIRAKFERLSSIIANIRELGILSPEKIAAADSEVKKLGASIQRYEKFEQERIAAEQKFVIEQAKEVEQTQTLEGRVKGLAQAAREYMKANSDSRWSSSAYGKDLTIYAEGDVRARGLSIEEQIRRQLEAEQQVIQQQVSTSQQLNNERKKYVSPTINDDIYQITRNAIARKLGIDTSKVINADAQYDSIKRVGDALKQLQDAYTRMTNEERNSPIGKQMIRQMQELQRQSQQLRAQMSRPISLKDALSGSEKTLDDIAYKMQRLRAYKQGIDLTKPNTTNEIKQVDEALARLQKDADKWMSKSNEMIKSNTALGRSWNYMKNRLAFYFTVGASTQFVKNLIEIRSQYEMNERALGILIDSAERGTRIFNELSQMALVSPYTLIELSTAAKQLTAYDVAAKDVVDTTRRLADMAAAVGIPIERLTYALGQIKAYGYLNARDARMFSNAGIPLVKQLAEHYTELEGKMVSTADVYDRIKKKAIDMTDVMQVINKMTDEGGKFFDFQAKMAGTLKVQLANLTLAWNNMLNDIGASEQGTISTGIGLLKELFLEWKNISKMVTNLAIGFGVVKAAQLAYYGVVMGTNKAIALETVLGNRLSNNLRSLASSTNAARMSSTALWVGIATFAAAAVVDILRGNEAMKEFNKTLRENAENTYNDLKKFSENYSGLRESLYKTENGKQTPVDINSEEAKKAWEVLREQIELSSHASDEYISKLLSIENVSERLRQGFAMIESIQSVSAAIKELGDSSIKLERDWSEWWNLGLLPDGTIGNLQDAYIWLSKIEEKYGSVVNARKVASTSRTDEGLDNVFQDEAKEFVENYETELEKFREDLQVTKQSVIDFIELKGWSGDTSKINEAFKIFTDNLISKNQLNPQQAYTLQLEMEEARSKAAKQAQYARVKDLERAYYIEKNKQHREELAKEYEKEAEIYNNWDNFNGRKKVEWERFTKWLKEQHISETTAMFSNMDAEDIRSLNFQEGKHAEWVKRMVTQYAKEHKMSYDEAFKYLKSWVTSANQWSIFIPMTISTEDSKTVYKQLGEYDKAVDEADAQIERLTKRINELNAKKKKSKEETKELADAEKELTQAQKDKADAEAKGGHGKKEKKDERAANKAAKQAESELAKALKDELSTIEKVRSIYKDLTKEGMSHANAVERATKGWDETVNAINRVLQKNGLRKLDLSKFAGIENPRELVNMLQSQLNTLLKRGAKPAEIKELQTKIQTLNVDAEKYDLTKITKGLNNELGKLKDEYELAVAIDADPELGNAFADMMGINVESLPHTVKEYADEYSKYLNKYLKGKDSALQFTGDDLRGLTRDDITAFRKQVDAGSFNQEWFDAILKAYEDISGKRKKDLEETEKWKNSLIEKYGNLQDKLTKIYKDSVQNQVNAVKTFGTEDQKSNIVRLQLRLEATDNPAELTEINTEIAKIVKGVTDKNPIALKLVTASDNQTKSDTSKAYWEDFKNSELYSMTFEDMANNSSRAIELIIEKLNGLKDKVKEDPASMKALIKSLEDAEKELNTRDPFGGVARSLREMAAASRETKAAQEALWRAEVDVEQAQQEVDNAEDGTPEEQADAQQKLADAVQRRAVAQVKLTQAENKGKKAQENLKSSLQGVTGQLGNVKSLFDTVSSLFRAGGDDETADAIDAISEGFSIMTTVIMGVVAAMVLLESSQPWLLAIAAALSVIVGLVKFLSGNDNEKIDKEVKESERAVKRLEIAYKDLEDAVNNAYGASTSGAKRAALANKELQLAEIKRQIQLEKSRDSKDRDEDRILDLQAQYRDLLLEIKNGVTDIVNEMLGISSVGDGITSIVEAMIDAFRNGEDAMKAFSDKWDEMIDNMILKLIVSQYMQKAWDNVMNVLKQKEEEFLAKSAQDKADAESELTKYNLIGDRKQQVAAYAESVGGFWEGQAVWGFDAAYDEWAKKYDEYINSLNEKIDSANTAAEKSSEEYLKWSLDYMMGEGRDYMTGVGQNLADALGEWYTFGQDKDKQLSALQQGLQGVSEETASAVEAYLNGMSQQAYLRNDLLTQIRDTIMSFDMDVQLGVFSQMLLQLQNNYVVMQSMQSMMENWTVPSGSGIRVELMS